MRLQLHPKVGHGRQGPFANDKDKIIPEHRGPAIPFKTLRARIPAVMNNDWS